MLPLLLALAAAAATPTHPFGAADMVAMQRIGEHVVSPDGRRVAFSLRTSDVAANRGRFDLWTVNVDGTGLRQLTTDAGNETSPAWSADGRSVYFLATSTGSSQVHRMPADGGPWQQVTKLARDVETFALGPGDRLVVAMAVLPGRTPEQTAAHFEAKTKSNVSAMVYEQALVRHWDTWKDGTRNHLFVVDASGAARDLMPAMHADAPTKPFGGRGDLAFAPDGRTLVFVARDVGREEAWSTNLDLFSVPLDGSAPPRKLTTNPATDTTPAFSPDGRTLAWLAMTRPGFEADRLDVMVRDLASGLDTRHVVRVGSGPNDDRSPDELAFSTDGRELLVSAYHLGHRAAMAVEVATGKARLLVAEGHVSGVMPAGDRILFARDSLLSPVELFTIDRDGRNEKTVTRINAERVAAARWGTPEAFTFAGAGGDTVYGWLVKPVDFDPAKTYPLAFLIHGGPQSSMGNLFHYRWNPQAYAGAGYVAVAIDFHGSLGYGQAFTDAISRDWSGKPYEDLQKGLDHVVAKYPFVDGRRACALGASYGGYMVNWIAGQPFADRFKCLVTHDGNLDERAAYFMTEELWFPEWEHGTPWENPEGYTKGNPVLHVQNWHVPHLVIHGAKDYRIVDAQGIATFNALQRRGVPSKFLHFPDENHWILKPANSLLWHETVLGWLDQWTKK